MSVTSRIAVNLDPLVTDLSVMAVICILSFKERPVSELAAARNAFTWGATSEVGYATGIAAVVPAASIAFVDGSLTEEKIT